MREKNQMDWETDVRPDVQKAFVKAVKKGKEEVSFARQPEKRIGFATDVGMKRKLDEDTIIAMEVMTAYESRKRKRVLLLVADGMGGHSKGEVASRIGAHTVAHKLHQLLTSEGEITDMTYHKELTDAILTANRKILDYSTKNAECEGMGTTISLAIIDGYRLHIASVGDSRVYVLNEEKIWQVTKDHSYVQELIDKGELSSEAARNHPQRNVITRVVGYYGELKANTGNLLLDENDFVVVCCDGLTTHAEDEEIRQIVLGHADPQKACDELIGLANKRGGTDNISIIIAPTNIVHW